MLRRLQLCLALATALSAMVLAISATLSSAQTAPAFTLGFKALADQIPDVAGIPVENEYFNLSNGNSEQHTTRGLMVWRKADNWTAFTNGYMSWINGPQGVQSRLNTERFDWENDHVATTPSPAQPTAAPAPAPTPAPAATATAPTNAAGGSTNACLSCHGPYDKLVSATANYVWPNGDKQTPHRYVGVDHDTKNVPACSNCHKPHPLPPTPSDIAAMGKADPQWCFTCHHTGTLQCGTCH